MQIASVPVAESASAVRSVSIHSRIQWLDSLRAVLMTLGIVFHTALVYSANPTWLVSDPQRWVGFDVLAYVIHLFRMPCFFLVSGLLSAVVMERTSRGDFLGRRAGRLLIPLLSSAVTLNLAACFLLYPGSSVTAWLRSGWQSHLWFLEDLFLFSVAGWGVSRLIGDRRESLSRFASDQGFTAIVLIAPVAGLLLRQLGHWWNQSLPLTVLRLDWTDLLHYGLFYGIGLVMGIAKVSRPTIGLAELAILGGIGALGIAARDFLPGYGGRVLMVFSENLMAWCATFASLILASRFLDGSVRLGARLASASYTVYLFHHPLVIALALSLRTIQLPGPVWMGALLKAAAIIAITFGATLWLHERLIARSDFLRFAFNGLPRQT